MTLEQSIHHRWAASSELNALLSSDRFFTGRSLSTAAPYATLARERTRPLSHTNSGRFEETLLRIHLWHPDHDLGQTIADHIEAVFDGCALDLGPQVRLTSIRCTERSNRRHDDGLWQFTLRFTARLFQSKDHLL